MDDNRVAGVAGPQHSIYVNGCDNVEAEKSPAETAGNSEDCRTFDPSDNAAAFASYYGLSAKRRVPYKGFVQLPGEFAEVRTILVEEVRYSDRPERLKRAAEAWVGNIDEIHKVGKNADNEAAFRECHVRFLRAAAGAPFPDLLPPVEIAKAFGLGDGGAA